MENEIVLHKYRKSENKSRILLLYLVINGYDLSKIERVIKVDQSKDFGLHFQRLFGETTEYVDVNAIYEDLAKIQVPIVCSLMSYEVYSNDKYIQVYSSKVKGKPLYINDMGIISKYMVIDKDFVISSKIASPVETADTKGFMYFVDYVLNDKCEVGDWKIIYKNKEFDIYYIENGEELLLYHAIEFDKTSSFKLVLYVIEKAVEKMEEIKPDNYVMEQMELIE